MNMLGVLMAGASVLSAAALGCHQVRRRREHAPGKNWFIPGFVLVMLAASAGLYAELGRWNDWETVQVDRDADHLLAAKITEARRQVQIAPRSAEAHRQLVQVSLQAGLYEEAVKATDTLLELSGESAELLGMKVFAQYYRDGRLFTDDTQRLIERVFALNPLEVQTRMLLGQDAYLNQRYEEAVRHWRMLLDAGVAPSREQALKNAIGKAEAQLNR